MAEAPPAASALRKAAQVSDHEIDGASDAVPADLATEACPLAKGWTLDLVETLRANTRHLDRLRQPGAETRKDGTPVPTQPTPGHLTGSSASM